MASGGLPPTINPMPPPRGWTPGPPTEPAQNHQDETLANSIWEVRTGPVRTQLTFCKPDFFVLVFDTMVLEYLKNSFFAL